MITLSLYETRVLGVLVEKESTTPDQYPLSLNALTNACNQKSNRDPVLNLEESQVQETIDELIKKRQVLEVVVGSRVRKYKHRFGNTEFSEYKLSAKALGIICVLFLRGPQTPGELRTRTNRLCEFVDVREVESVLDDLIGRDGDPYVAKLPREPGKRESRYMHLFGDETAPQEVVGEGAGGEAVSEVLTEVLDEGTSPSPATNRQGAAALSHERRIAELEQLVVEMSDDIAELKAQWKALAE